MKFVSTATHAFIDYFISISLLVSPWLMGFAFKSTETSVFVIAGISIIIFNLLTNHELGALKIIPMAVHVGIDMTAGLFITFSPWLLGFAERVYIPHLIIGMFEITMFFSLKLFLLTRRTKRFIKNTYEGLETRRLC